MTRPEFSEIRWNVVPSFANWINKWVVIKTFDEHGDSAYLWIYQYNKTAKEFLSNYEDSLRCSHIGWLWNNGNQFAVFNTEMGAQELWEAADNNGWDTKEFMPKERGNYTKALLCIEDGRDSTKVRDEDGWCCQRSR